jgi:hypothetical protein
MEILIDKIFPNLPKGKMSEIEADLAKYPPPPPEPAKAESPQKSEKEKATSKQEE